MDKNKAKQLYEIADRLSKMDLSKLSEKQLAERDQLIAQLKEVSDKTLMSYLTKVHTDSQKHKMDPTKRSPEKASKSVGGFTRAFNKLDARKEQDVAEGTEDSPVAQAIIRRILMRRADLLAKYGPEKVGEAVDYVAEYVSDFVSDNDEIGTSDVSGWVKQVEQHLQEIGESAVQENDLAQQMLALARQKNPNARIAGTPEQERERTQQMLAQRAKEREEQSRQTGLADYGNIAELESQLKGLEAQYQSLGGSNWQYADREQNLTDAERKARAMEPELNRLRSKIALAKKHGASQSESVHEAINTEAYARLRKIFDFSDFKG